MSMPTPYTINDNIIKPTREEIFSLNDDGQMILDGILGNNDPNYTDDIFEALDEALMNDTSQTEETENDQ